MYNNSTFTCFCTVLNSKRSHLGIYNIPRKQINKKFDRLMNKCSNPLNYHKKSCIVFWDYVDEFNHNIDRISYEIENMDTKDTDIDFKLKTCEQNDGTLILDECKVFDD